MLRFASLPLTLLTAVLLLSACDAGGAEELAPGTFEAVVTGSHEMRLDGPASFRLDGPAFSLSLSTGTLPGLPDSLRIPRDSLVLPRDSFYTLPDSLRTPRDSLFLPRDSLIVPDSLFARDPETGIFLRTGEPRQPPMGTYPVAFFSLDGFFGHTLLTTNRKEPLFFLAEQGEVTITASNAERVSGTFTLFGRSLFLGEGAVEVAGSFVAVPE